MNDFEVIKCENMTDDELLHYATVSGSKVLRRLVDMIDSMESAYMKSAESDYEAGRDDGYDSGYDEGYNEGYEDGQNG